ncbi:MAG: hydrogenase nickel incorporation protein HypB [Anaerolineae bacterium]|nr:hydrogenase nickel incorporation protein HypB [Anaerolineae bacterium]
MPVQKIKVVEKVLSGNDKVADKNRERFEAANILAVNLMASPGAGKTSLIVKTIETLGHRAQVGVIEGDITGSIDTERVLAAGAVDAVQINTGGNCHLEANMVQAALDDLNLGQLSIVFVENVGNLVCPTHWALGEQIKLCLLGAAEGDDKPVKYPEMFTNSDVIILNKIDLIDFVDFDRDFFYESVRALNPQAPVFEISCRSGVGLGSWADWLLSQQSRFRNGGASQPVTAGKSV